MFTHTHHSTCNFYGYVLISALVEQSLKLITGKQGESYLLVQTFGWTARKPPQHLQTSTDHYYEYGSVWVIPKIIDAWQRWRIALINCNFLEGRILVELKRQISFTWKNPSINLQGGWGILTHNSTSPYLRAIATLCYKAFVQVLRTLMEHWHPRQIQSAAKSTNDICRQQK